MSFLSAYKRLDKICGEIMNDDRRISAYIDEMSNSPRGAYLVAGWEEDLKRLKHYRWVRNRIAHEPDCEEENMCTPADAQWLDLFYQRIFNRTDPLALYAKAVRPRPAPRPVKPRPAPTPMQPQKVNAPAYTYPQNAADRKDTEKRGVTAAKVLGVCVILLIAVCLFVLGKILYMLW